MAKDRRFGTLKKHSFHIGKKRKMKRIFLEALDLPQETEPTLPKLTMLGRTDLLVENHRGVLQYDRDAIKLLTHEGVLHIKGDALALMELAKFRVYVRGEIAGVEYLDD